MNRKYLGVPAACSGVNEIKLIFKTDLCFLSVWMFAPILKRQGCLWGLLAQGTKLRHPHAVLPQDAVTEPDLTPSTHSGFTSESQSNTIIDFIKLLPLSIHPFSVPCDKRGQGRARHQSPNFAPESHSCSPVQSHLSQLLLCTERTSKVQTGYARPGNQHLV